MRGGGVALGSGVVAQAGWADAFAVGSKPDCVSPVLEGMSDGACVNGDVLNAPFTPGVLASHLGRLGGIMKRPCQQQWWRVGRALVHHDFVLLSVHRCLVFVARAASVGLKGLADEARSSWVLTEALLTLGVDLSWLCRGREGKGGRCCS